MRGLAFGGGKTTAKKNCMGRGVTPEAGLKTGVDEKGTAVIHDDAKAAVR